jgi:hypothetical protein
MVRGHGVSTGRLREGNKASGREEIELGGHGNKEASLLATARWHIGEADGGGESAPCRLRKKREELRDEFCESERDEWGSLSPRGRTKGK